MQVEGYRCSSSPGTCEVADASRDGTSVTMRLDSLPQSGVIHLTTPTGEQDIEVPDLPGEGVENCDAEITCPNGERKGCTTPIVAVAWACSAGSGAATCMYLPADYLDEWLVANVTCD